VELNVKSEGNRVCFEIDGIIDEKGAETLNHRFGQLDVANVEELVLDFANVEYIGSAGVGRLLMFYKELTAKGGTLRIEKVSGMVHELLTITRMDTVFSISTA